MNVILSTLILQAILKRAQHPPLSSSADGCKTYCPRMGWLPGSLVVSREWGSIREGRCVMQKQAAGSELQLESGNRGAGPFQ